MCFLLQFLAEDLADFKGQTHPQGDDRRSFDGLRHVVDWMKRNGVFDPVADKKFPDDVARHTSEMRIGALVGAMEGLARRR